MPLLASKVLLEEFNLVAPDWSPSGADHFLRAIRPRRNSETTEIITARTLEGTRSRDCRGLDTWRRQISQLVDGHGETAWDGCCPQR